VRRHCIVIAPAEINHRDRATTHVPPGFCHGQVARQLRLSQSATITFEVEKRPPPGSPILLIVAGLHPDDSDIVMTPSTREHDQILSPMQA